MPVIHEDLDAKELAIAELVGLGWSDKRIAAHLKNWDGSPLSESSVHSYIHRIAKKITNPQKVAAKMVVMRWAIRQEVLRELSQKGSKQTLPSEPNTSDSVKASNAA